MHVFFSAGVLTRVFEFVTRYMPEPAPTDDVVCPIPLAQRAEERCQLNYWAYMVDLLQCLVGLQVVCWRMPGK